MVILTQQQRQCLEKIVEVLESGKYENLVCFGANSEVIDEAAEAIAQYKEATGEEMTHPPTEEFLSPDIAFEETSETTGITTTFICFPLWFSGKRSELSVEIYMEPGKEGLDGYPEAHITGVSVL